MIVGSRGGGQGEEEEEGKQEKRRRRGKDGKGGREELRKQGVGAPRGVLSGRMISALRWISKRKAPGRGPLR